MAKIVAAFGDFKVEEDTSEKPYVWRVVKDGVWIEEFYGLGSALRYADKCSGWDKFEWQSA